MILQMLAALADAVNHKVVCCSNIKRHLSETSSATLLLHLPLSAYLWLCAASRMYRKA